MAVKQAYPLGSLAVPQKALANNASGKLDSITLDGLRSSVRSAIERLGFPIGDELVPKMEHGSMASLPAPELYGFLVGEAGLRFSDYGVRRSGQWGIALMLLGAVSIPLVLLADPTAFPHSAFLFLPTIALLMVGALTWVNRAGVFESLIVSVQYWCKPEAPSSTQPINALTSFHANIIVHAGPMVTKNVSGGKGVSSCRDFRAIGIGDGGMTRIPNELLRELGTDGS